MNSLLALLRSVVRHLFPDWGVEPSVQLVVEPSVQLGSEPSVQLGGSSQASSLGSVVGLLFADFVGIWAQVRSGCGLRSFRGGEIWAADLVTAPV